MWTVNDVLVNLKAFFGKSIPFIVLYYKKELICLSMNLQRGNALCVMGTVAHHRKLEEIYHLGTKPTEED